MIFSLPRHATRLSPRRRNWLLLFSFLDFAPKVSVTAVTLVGGAFFSSIAIVEIEWGVFVQARTSL
jgi:hypothetical protein